MSIGSSEGDRLYNQETRIRLESLEKRFESHVEEEKDMWEEVSKDLKQMSRDIGTVRDDSLKKPSWATAIVITFLSSTTVGLIVASVVGK